MLVDFAHAPSETLIIRPPEFFNHLNKAQKRRLAEAMLLNISAWENHVLGAAIEALFPDTLTIDELLTLLETVEPPSRYSVNLLDRAMQEVVSFDCPPLQQAPLLAGVLSLLGRERYIERPCWKFSQGYAGGVV